MTSRIPLPSGPDQDDAYFRAVLLALVDQGAALARTITERASAATPTLENRPDADPTVAFDRVARTIRRTIALARHIAAGKTAPHAAGIAARTAARSSLIRSVEDALHRKARNNENLDTARLQAEFAETLEDPALEFDLASRPVAEIIEEICRDLGIDTATRSFVFKRRTPADRKALRARAAQPSPLPGREGLGEGELPGRTPPPSQDERSSAGGTRFPQVKA